MRARAAVLVVTCSALVACGARRAGPTGPSAVADDAAGAGGPTDGGQAASGPREDVVAAFRAATTRVSGQRFVSKGHAGGRWDVDVWADAAGALALRGGRGPVPVGARFLEEHFEHDAAAGSAGEARGPLMMMEKKPPGFDPAHGDWRYVVVGASGEVVKDGVVESCAGCHGDAPGDHVFVIDAAR